MLSFNWYCASCSKSTCNMQLRCRKRLKLQSDNECSPYSKKCNILMEHSYVKCEQDFQTDLNETTMCKSNHLQEPVSDKSIATQTLNLGNLIKTISTQVNPCNESHSSQLSTAASETLSLPNTIAYTSSNVTVAQNALQLVNKQNPPFDAQQPVSQTQSKTCHTSNPAHLPNTSKFSMTLSHKNDFIHNK